MELKICGYDDKAGDTTTRRHLQKTVKAAFSLAMAFSADLSVSTIVRLPSVNEARTGGSVAAVGGNKTAES